MIRQLLYNWIIIENLNFQILIDMIKYSWYSIIINMKKIIA